MRGRKQSRIQKAPIKGAEGMQQNAEQGKKWVRASHNSRMDGQSGAAAHRRDRGRARVQRGGTYKFLIAFVRGLAAASCSNDGFGS